MTGTVTVVKRTISRVLPAEYSELCYHLRRQGLVAGMVAMTGIYLCARMVFASLMQHLLWLFLCSEVVFFAYYCYRYRQLNKQPERHEPDNHEAMEHFARFLDCNRAVAGSVDIRRYLSMWFLGADFEDIKRDNVAELLTYGFWYRSRGMMAAQGMGDIPDKMVNAVETSWGVKFPPGYNPGIKFMSHLWDPLPAFHRPLAFYVITELLSLIGRAMITGFGFKEDSHAGVTYYTCNMDVSGTPIVLLHGVALGVVPYLELIKCLVASGQPVIVIEYKHVSMRLCNHIPTACELARAVVGVLDLLSVPRACIVAHSYGTFVASRLLKKHRSRVASLALLDPVCFGMFMPYLLHSFFYRQLSLKEGLRQMLKRMLLFLVSRDLSCAATMARCFYWTDLNLWPSELPQETLVVLHGLDELVHVPETHMVMKAHNVEVMVHPDKAHAEFLLDLKWQDEIVHRIVQLAQGWPVRACLRSDSASSYNAGAIPGAAACTASMLDDAVARAAALAARGSCRTNNRLTRRATVTLGIDPTSLERETMAARMATVAGIRPKDAPHHTNVGRENIVARTVSAMASVAG